MRWIADGGMGSVFEAENTWTKRRVAITVLGPERVRSQERVRRFLREAQSSTRIEHPNVVDVLDMGEDRATGALFIVQELLRGKDLKRHLRDSPGRRLSPVDALAILLPIMEALEAAHQFGVLHRDVKPANIFLSQQGGHVMPKLIDFGLSKILDAEESASPTAPTTGAGVPIGTPHYMSPEQAIGEVVDARCDVWSIGVVLYECLTGRPPYDAPTLPALLMKIANERPRPVDERADVPADVAAIVHRALEPDRDRRFGSMTELLHAVRETAVYAQQPASMSGPHRSVSGPVRALRPGDLSGDHVDPDEGAGAADDRREIVVAPYPTPKSEPKPTFERVSWIPSKPPPPGVPATPRAPRSSKSGRLRFGLVLAGGAGDEASRSALEELGRILGKGWLIAVASSYGHLVDALAEGDLDLGWLPPVAYVRAARAGAARPLLTFEREGRRSYSSAIVARTGEIATLADLAGKRVAWVDPWSAAGYLVPRCMLRHRGIQPERDFRSQAYVGSYVAVLRSILDGDADVGAIFCHLDENGEMGGTLFREERRVRPVAVSSEPIPGDTMCAPASAPIEHARANVRRFLESTASHEARYVLRQVFGTDRFVAANPSRYEGLAAALDEDVTRTG